MSYFFYVRLDWASVAASCFPSFRRSWGIGGNVMSDFYCWFSLMSKPHFFRSLQPIPPFPEELIGVCDLLRGGPIFLGHFLPERIRAAVEIHQSQIGPSVKDDMEVNQNGFTVPAVQVFGQNGGGRWFDVEDDEGSDVDNPFLGFLEQGEVVIQAYFLNSPHSILEYVFKTGGACPGFIFYSLPNVAFCI